MVNSKHIPEKINFDTCIPMAFSTVILYQHAVLFEMDKMST